MTLIQCFQNCAHVSVVDTERIEMVDLRQKWCHRPYPQDCVWRQNPHYFNWCHCKCIEPCALLSLAFKHLIYINQYFLCLFYKSVYMLLKLAVCYCPVYQFVFVANVINILTFWTNEPHQLQSCEIGQDQILDYRLQERESFHKSMQDYCRDFVTQVSSCLSVCLSMFVHIKLQNKFSCEHDCSILFI